MSQLPHTMSHLPLRSLNHVSTVVADVRQSVEFFERVLGFSEIKRPDSFDFGGAWLWRHGMALHLIQGVPVKRDAELRPCSDHISFQADTSLDDCARRLDALGVPFVRERVQEGGVVVEQLFFHTPDKLVIEVCNCDSLPIRPLNEEQRAWRCASCMLDEAVTFEAWQGGAASDTSEDTVAARMSTESSRSTGT